ncbi:hypothetical protein DAPPUDRAFT_111204 [Daphnia pulex]|uniref:Endonuclease/exonuclease/phosphatase domain-containing protein n=1 Tax=Daphnia pulex TaxID=6669 RepID=E9H8J0_DAPPU|nr:hypothetical protein DAPPUDRAFT_111204 [Daphnia pulex]|eukprot:EFX71955.1 hypothetical protein DAPPUDRAFT_111204 [Daphnia pulex]
MHIAERMRIQNEIISVVGEPRESTVLMGGDLAVLAHNKNQQADLIALKNILGRPVLCSLPNSASAYRTGTKPYVVGGDFNGHHSLWEPNSIEKKAGKSIHEALIKHPNACLITTLNLGTRIDPASGKDSTIDLTITSPTIAVSTTFTPGPYMGSDHLPLIITLNARETRLINRPVSWKLNEDNWTQWNLHIEENLRQRNFINITDPEDAIATFSECIETSNTRYFKKTNPNVNANVTKNPTRPWWNESCQDVVKKARKAFREWRVSPLSLAKRMEWKKAEAEKWKFIIVAKRHAWSTFVSNLGPNDQPKMWSFVKTWQETAQTLLQKATPSKTTELPAAHHKRRRNCSGTNSVASTLRTSKSTDTTKASLNNAIRSQHPNKLNGPIT